MAGPTRTVSVWFRNVELVTDPPTPHDQWSVKLPTTLPVRSKVSDVLLNVSPSPRSNESRSWEAPMPMPMSHASVVLLAVKPPEKERLDCRSSALRSANRSELNTQ